MGVLFTNDRGLRTGERLESIYFRRLIYVTLAVFASYLLRSLARYGSGNELLNTGMSCLEILLTVICGLSWLVFVDAYVFDSPDRIRRRYRFSLIPIAYLFVLSLLLCVCRDRIPVLSLVLFFILFFSAVGICIAYISYAYRIARCYRIEAAQPLFLRLEVFIIPWIFCFANDLLPLPAADPIFTALAVLFTYLTIKRRDRFVDKATGFYLKTALPQIDVFLNKNGRKKGSAVLFVTEGNDETFAAAVSMVKPDSSMIFRLEDNEYLLVSDMTAEPAIRLLIQMVCKEVDGARIKAEYRIRKEGESLVELSQRIGKKA